MSSTRSSNSPATMEEAKEPRKKGSRDGKRSVSHLSKTQLARKRANDREAQRNIRQRTKEHIEALEKKVKELESVNGSSGIEIVLKRNKELEAEIEELKSKVSMQQTRQVPVPIPPDAVSEGLMMPPKVPLDWMPEPSSSQWPGASQIIDLEAEAESSVPNAPYPNPQMYPSGASLTSMEYTNEEVEAANPLYSPLAIPVWEDPIVFGSTSQSLTKPTPAWKPFHPAFSQPSRFADLQESRFSDLIATPTYGNSTCWQSQPSIYAWQISTKLKAPITLVDQLMFGVIHSQRHLAITADITGEELIGPSFPSVNLLFNQPAPAKPPSTLTEVMARYSAVLSNRGFALIPEKLASFMCMYRFVQWQISPTYSTYQALHDWQAPRPSQLTIPHPAWMDLPPWGKFRDKLIENQVLYDNIEFQNDYASNLSVNFPFDPMKALIFEDGQIKVSTLMERHLADIENMSMKKPFADKYPEFHNVCRFDLECCITEWSWREHGYIGRALDRPHHLG